MLQPIQLFQHYPGLCAAKQKLELWTFNGASTVVESVRCWDEGQPATMLVPLQATLYISNFCFPVSSICSFICYFHSVCDVFYHQTTHCVCQEKYKNVRAAYYSAAQGDQTTWPLHHHVKDITHAHFPPPHEHTHIHTLLLFHTVRITLHRKLAREHRLLS